jgi:tetratricopeptide (TPR) repeat protein
VIELKRGKAREALERFDRALSLASTLDRKDFLFWRAKLGRSVADAHDLLGDRAASENALRQAVKDFELLLASRNLVPDDVADLLLERGKALYQVGQRVQAILSLEKAVDAAPERASTYADVLAFLIPRGERDEALDAYHRALGRSEVSEYIKVYCTLWILDLERRAGNHEDPLARAFLDGVDGGKWYHGLARWASGRASDSDLEARVEGPGNRAEVYFYRAMRSLREGRTDEARALWRKVIDTGMMAFFEFDMAAYYLRHGPAVAPSPPRPTTTAAAVPD